MTLKLAIFTVRYADGHIINVEAHDSVEAVTEAQRRRPGVEIVSSRYVGAYSPKEDA